MSVSVSVLALALSVAGPVRAEETVAASGAVSTRLLDARDALVDGKRDMAMAAFSSLIDGGKDVSEVTRARAHLGRAYGHQQARDYEAAVGDYTAALKHGALDDETRAVALYNRGLAHRKLGKPDAAVEDITNALFIDVEFAHAYMSRGLLMRESDRPLYALSDFDKALKYGYPDTYAVVYAQGLAHEDLDRPQQAQAAYARALMMKPDFAKARQRLAALVGVDPSELAVTAPSSTPRVAGADALKTGSAGDTLPDAVRPTNAAAAPARQPDDDAGPRRAGVAVPEAPSPDGGDGREPVKLASLDAGDAVAASGDGERAEPDERAEPMTLKGWLVQLSAQRDEPSAWNVWDSVEKRHAGLIDGYKPVVMRADLGQKGVYYRLRLAGFDNKSDASSLCSKLKANGSSCYVAKAD